MTLIWAIIGFTVLISFRAFQDPELRAKLLFLPTQINYDKEYYRFVSSGFIHADTTHLAFNMITLFFFADNVLRAFEFVFQGMGSTAFIIFYLAAIVVSSLTSYFKNKDNHAYSALGASGGVSAVIFASILFEPNARLGLYFIIPVKAWIFGILYLVMSHYMAKRNMDNIGHEAHFWGGVFGFLFPLVYEPSLLGDFVEQIMNP